MTSQLTPPSRDLGAEARFAPAHDAVGGAARRRTRARMTAAGRHNRAGESEARRRRVEDPDGGAVSCEEKRP